MKFIRPREIIVCIIAACTVYACATGSTNPGGGGSGGEGGDSWGGPSSSSKSSASSSGSNSSSSGSSGGTYCDTNSSDCMTCSSCSATTANGLCGSEADACSASIDCGDFITCIDPCASGDTACFSNCESLYPTGKDLYLNYASCVICQDCYVTCTGADACMAP